MKKSLRGRYPHPIVRETGSRQEWINQAEAGVFSLWGHKSNRQVKVQKEGQRQEFERKDGQRSRCIILITCTKAMDILGIRWKEGKY